MRKWKPPRHGKESKYIHIRLKPPSRFDRMRTVSIGDGLKQIRGRIKGTTRWEAQNIMLPRKAVSLTGNRIVVQSKKIKERLKRDGINISKIKHMTSGGSADYRIASKR